MSVVTDLQSAIRSAVLEFQASAAVAVHREERLLCMFNYAMALHGIYVRMKPFKAELSAAGAWSIVRDGDNFCRNIAKPLSTLIVETLEKTAGESA